jgi:hypothetical protein
VVVNKARFPQRSTSVPSNLLEESRLKAAAEVLGWIGTMLEEE